MGSFWAFSEGMPLTAGKLYVFDVLSIVVAALLVGIGDSLNTEGLGWMVAALLFFVARLYVGFRAPQWLTAFLIARGYHSSE